jgi:hypothetical protein
MWKEGSSALSGIPRIFLGGGVGWGGGVYTRNFFWAVKQIQFRIEGRENGDLGVVAPYSRVPLNLQMNETHILIRLLRMYIPRSWEFGSAFAKLRNFGGVPNPPSVCHCVHLMEVCELHTYTLYLWRKILHYSIKIVQE